MPGICAAGVSNEPGGRLPAAGGAKGFGPSGSSPAGVAKVSDVTEAPGSGGGVAAVASGPSNDRGAYADGSAVAGGSYGAGSADAGGSYDTGWSAAAGRSLSSDGSVMAGP